MRGLGHRARGRRDQKGLSHKEGMRCGECGEIGHEQQHGRLVGSGPLNKRPVRDCSVHCIDQQHLILSAGLLSSLTGQVAGAANLSNQLASSHGEFDIAWHDGALCRYWQAYALMVPMKTLYSVGSYMIDGLISYCSLVSSRRQHDMM